MHDMKVSVDMSTLIAYLPEIVKCIHSPSEESQSCKLCQFKQECMIVSAVRFYDYQIYKWRQSKLWL